MRFLLDTNVLSEPLRREPKRAAMQKLQRHQGEIAIASVIWHEMWFGCRRMASSAKRRAVEEYLRTVIWPTVPILPYDEPAAEWHALERARLVVEGKTPAFADGQIAAVAAVNDLILVTGNVKGYSVFQDLKVENWL